MYSNANGVFHSNIAVTNADFLVSRRVGGGGGRISQRRFKDEAKSNLSKPLATKAYTGNITKSNLPKLLNNYISLYREYNESKVICLTVTYTSLNREYNEK